MSKSCVSCKKWEDHYYWNHMDQKKLQFFKIMTGDFTQSMSIPEKFSKNFTGKISEAVDLKGPSGKTWHIGVANLMDELVLQSGWKDFVSAHDIEKNDLLIFRYSGNSSFEVQIFDSSGCEKPSCLFVKKVSATMRERNSNSVEIVTVQPERCSLSSSPGNRIQQNSNRRIGKEPGPSKYTTDDNLKQESLELDESNEAERSKYFFQRSRAAYDLTEAVREEILGLPPLQPGNPAFVIVIRKTHIQRSYSCLIIPSDFAAAHLRPEKQEIVLTRPNKREQWHVSCYYSDYTRRFNCRHWMKFACDNKMREGYVCVFELMKGERRVTMTVHMIRKVRERFVLLS